MPDEALHADFHQRVHVRTAAMPWQASPAGGVERKRLELRGPVEAGRVTSVVRYAPGSRFPPHGHPDGEEILVLDGVFEDEHGRYPAGSYLLNPEGFSHAPRSGAGCELFVKLRQYAGQDRPTVRVDTRVRPLLATGVTGISAMDLYAEAGRLERVRLVRYAPGAERGHHLHVGGEELFVLDGSLEDEHGRYEIGDWLRMPAGSAHSPRSPRGCLLYLKTGHLPSTEAR